MTAPAPHRPVAAIALRLLAMLMLGIMFVLVKLAAARGVHLIESLFWRQAAALPLIAGWAMLSGGVATIRTARIGAHARRAAMGLTGMALNFSGMILLPMAEATTISLSVPIFSVLLAAILLGERIGPWRWAAVLFGFVGVVVALRPGDLHWHDAMGLGALIALGGAMMTALINIAVRDLGRTENATTTVFWFSGLSMIPLGIAMPFVVTAHDPLTWGLIAGLALCGAVAQLLLTAALRLGPVAVVIPMDYSGLIWSLLFGWWIFGQLPASSTWLGAPLIIASGLVILWREQVRKVSRQQEIAS
jgi:drug/metabolite transporter (DMT)-like permease